MEYQLAPSPMRADYLGSQQLNPVKLLPYSQLIYRGVSDGQTTIANTATERSLYDYFSAFDTTKSFAGAAVLSDGATNTRLVFPGKFFAAGDILRTTLFGGIGNNLVANTIRFRQIGWDSESDYGSDYQEIYATTNSTVAATDLDGLCQIVWTNLFSLRTGGIQLVQQTIHGWYSNNNTPERMTLVRRTSDTERITTIDRYSNPSYLNHTVTWSSASATNIMRPYYLLVEKL